MYNRGNKILEVVMKIADIRNAQVIEDLEVLNIGNLDYNIGMRGGYLGFYGHDIAEALNIDENLLPGKVGAYCNYLGGGVRGKVVGSGYSDKIIGKRKIQLLDTLIAACIRVYLNEEAEIFSNDNDDEINWDVEATNCARNSGIISAY
jgi:hypothetical protein